MRCVRVAAWTSCLILWGCGGSLVAGTESGGGGGNPGTTRTTTDRVPITAGSGNDGLGGSGVPSQDGGSTVGGAGGDPVLSIPCGASTCRPGLRCCNPTCGLCVEENFPCPSNACESPPVPFDAGEGAGDPVSLKSNYGFVWKDSWFITPCLQKAGSDCINASVCPNQQGDNFEDRGIVTTETFPIGGDPGATYAVTFTFNAISEGKYYEGGKRDAGDEIPSSINSAFLDTFYAGGTPVISNYNVLRMRVFDASKNEVARYYLNSFPPVSVAESRRTFHLSYTKTIDVPGRGFVEHTIQDPNCHAIDNCNDGSPFEDCNDARPIPNESHATLPAMYPEPITNVLVPLAKLNVETGAAQPWHAQIGHLTVIKVVSK